MPYYLRLNGTTDYIKLPSLTINKIVADVKIRRRADAIRVLWDFRSGISFTYIIQQTNGTDSIGSGSVKINGNNVSNGTAFIPNDTRVTIEHTFTLGTDDGNVFCNNTATANSFISGDIYNIKLYNNTTLVAHYDMTLGNIQDQSGNGRHATLIGGTWLQDGSSGVAGSVTHSMKQVLYDAKSTNHSLKQTISNTGSIANSTLQRMYDNSSIAFETKQCLFEISKVDSNLLQKMFNRASSVVDTMQNIVSIDSNTSPLMQFIYDSSLVNNSMMQQIFAEEQNLADILQSIHDSNSLASPLLQSIFDVSHLKSDLMTYIVSFDSSSSPLRIIFIDDSLIIIGKVKLAGKLDSQIKLNGLSDLKIRLRGEV
ncbi:hypothetical protein ACFQZE_07405 [Paenibacillus sp. GCM10027627]|uniref:hypothetical protein n=1 Tax=unclassified Paenibacillus TaxID=185978 RepID=UPI00363F0C9D